MSLDHDSSQTDHLAELFRLAREGNRDAAGELISNFEPEVRRFVRFRLASAGLRRIVDSVDVAQSVFARFYVYISGGAGQVDDVDELRKYLVAAAKYAVIDRVRRERAGRRDNRRVDAGAGEHLETVAGGSNTPSVNLAQRELVTLIQDRLTPDERYLVDQWLAGRPWDDVAAEKGGTADALRKQMGRALDRVARELNLIPGGGT